MSDISAKLPVSEARKNLYDIVDETVKKYRRFIVTHRSGGSITILPTEEIDSLEESLEIMNDKKLLKNIADGLGDIKRGRTKTLEEVEKSTLAS